MSITYTHAPRPTAGPVSFRLDGDRLTVDTGRKVQEVRLGAVETVRLTYEPRSFAQNAFQTRVRLTDGKTFAFSSLSWKSLIEAERKDGEYRAFLAALLPAIAAASPKARFLGGRPRAVWILVTALAFASLLALAWFAFRALSAGAMGAAAMGALFFALGIWQLEPMVRRNRPTTFRPDAPPTELMP